MSDIVERLRSDGGGGFYAGQKLILEAADEIEALHKRAKVAEYDKANQWHDISTAPKDDTLKLIAYQNGEICITPGIARGPMEVTAQFDPGFTPILWMPLPTPPESGQ